MNKNTNKPKKRQIIKQQTPSGRNFHCFQPKRIYKVNQANKRSKDQITYIALDTNIIIDMIYMMEGRARCPKKSDAEYFANLKRLLQNSIFYPDGRKNPHGKIVFCLLPSVKAEISSYIGSVHKHLANFVENRTIDLEIDENFKNSFRKKTKKLAQEYAQQGYFLNENKEIEMDAYVVAEASFFNLTLISRDHDITVNREDANPERKIEKIKFVNRKFLQSDFNGNQAEPRKVANFLTCYSNGRVMPELQNSTILREETKSKLHQDLNYRPTKDAKEKVLV